MEIASEGAGSLATLPGGAAMFAVGLVVDEASAKIVADSLQRVHEALVSEQVGEYSSFIQVPSDASSFYAQETWSRLRVVKRLYDPADLFRGNHHIPPSTKHPQEESP